MGSEVLIVSTGVANLASVRAGLRRVGATYTNGADADDVRRADRVIVPGVGAFAPAMEKLQRDELADVLRERVAAGLPTLMICLGMHLLCRTSEESPGVEGLGVVDAQVLRFPDSVRVPQFGWNRVAAPEGATYLRSGYAYFANSFRLPVEPEGWASATAEHGGSFVAACERNDVVACQFHPELSGAYGAALLRRWLGGQAC